MTARERTHWRIAWLFWPSPALALLAACSQPLDSTTSGDDFPDDPQVAEARQSLNTGLPATAGAAEPLKGHYQVTKAALDHLKRRNLLPAVMATEENQYYLQYGDYFADNNWVGRPGTSDHRLLTTAVPHAMTGTTAVFSSDSLDYQWDDSHDLVPLVMKIATAGAIQWIDGVDNTDRPNTYFQINLTIAVLDRIQLVQDQFSVQNSVSNTFSLDNYYHFPFKDVYDMAGLTSTERDQNAELKLYPLTIDDLRDANGNLSDQDIAQKILNYLVNQPLLAGSDRGITKYGAILYQLARKFFVGSRCEPDVSELIRAGNDVPGWNVGTMAGTGILQDFSLQFPHTVLGGMPYVCAGGTNLVDPCADGKPTWPVWVPESEPASKNAPDVAAFLKQMQVTKPGRSDRAALIYLGWATHMIQDAATPHHAANWTGHEHARQDDDGDACWEPVALNACADGTLVDMAAYAAVMSTPEYAANPVGPCPGGLWPTQEQILSPADMDKFSSSAVNDLLGPESAPKTRAEVCSSIGVTDSQVVCGDLNWKSVQPVFLRTAEAAFAAKKTSISASDVKQFLTGAMLGTIKLLLCAAPESVPPGSGNNRGGADGGSGTAVHLGTSGRATQDAPGTSNDGGCACRAAGSRNEGTGTFAMVLAILGIAMRRRPERRSATSPLCVRRQQPQKSLRLERFPSDTSADPAKRRPVTRRSNV